MVFTTRAHNEFAQQRTSCLSTSWHWIWALECIQKLSVFLENWKGPPKSRLAQWKQTQSLLLRVHQSSPCCSRCCKLHFPPLFCYYFINCLFDTNRSAPQSQGHERTPHQSSQKPAEVDLVLTPKTNKNVSRGWTDELQLTKLGGLWREEKTKSTASACPVGSASTETHKLSFTWNNILAAGILPMERSKQVTGQGLTRVCGSQSAFFHHCTSEFLNKKWYFKGKNDNSHSQFTN